MALSTAKKWQEYRAADAKMTICSRPFLSSRNAQNQKSYGNF